MSVYLFANNATTTLAGPIAANATTVNLAAGTGVLFPSPSVGQVFTLTLQSQADAAVQEITYCTKRVTDTCTVLRGQEGTTATGFIAGDIGANLLTAGALASLIQAAQLQQQAGNYAVDVGIVNAIVAAPSPLPGSLALIAGSPIRILVAHTNTGPVTLTLSGLPTTTVVSQTGAPLTAGQIIGGQIFEFFYNPGIGFEVETPLAMLSLPNTFTAPQAMSAGLSVTSGLTVTSGGASVNGNVSATGNVNATSLVTGSTLVGTGPTLTIIPGGSGLNISNNANSAVNMSISDAGTVVVNRGQFTAIGDVEGNALITASGLVKSGSSTLTLIPGPSGMFFPNTANAAVNVSITDAGNVDIARGSLAVAANIASSSGGITAYNGRLSAAFGATSSGAPSTATILADFAAGVAGAGSWTTIPSYGISSTDTLILQVMSIGLPANNTPMTFNLPRAFPVTGLAVIISFQADLPPPVGACGAQFVGTSQILATNTSVEGGTNGCYVLAIGY